MNHYIYKITDTYTGQYYIGVRMCACEAEVDPYMGSGNWIRSFYPEYGWHLKNGKHRFTKTIVEHCGSREEAFDRENKCVGDLWFADDLCMNLCPGGGGTGVGEDHPNYDSTEYHMWNHNTGQELYVTGYELRKIGVVISRLKSDERISEKGICLYENKDKPYGYDANKGEDNTNYDSTEYHMWNRITETEFYMTTNELRKIGVLIRTLESGKSNHHKGICLYENKDKPFKDNFTKYHMWNHETEAEFYATANELRKIGVGVSNLKSGKCVQERGICLYENKDKPYGSDSMRGEDHPNYDSTEYHMWNHNTGKAFYMTTNELRKIGVRIDVLVSGKCVHEKGISLYKNKDVGIVIPMSDEKHHMWNHNTGKEFYMSTNELRKIGVVISQLKNANYTHMKGICLYENKDVEIRTMMSDEKHHMWNRNTGKEFYMTTNELSKIGVRIDVLVSGKRISAKGISLYENKDKKIRIIPNR